MQTFCRCNLLLFRCCNINSVLLKTIGVLFLIFLRRVFLEWIKRVCLKDPFAGKLFLSHLRFLRQNQVEKGVAKKDKHYAFVPTNDK